jgi:hypothetical protein
MDNAVSIAHPLFGPLIRRTSRSIGLNRASVFSAVISVFHKTSADQGVCVPASCDDMDVGYLAERVRVRPSHQRYALPLGVARIRNDQRSDARL